MARAIPFARALAAAAAAGALLLAGASAAWGLGTFFPAVAADGPSFDVRALGDVDQARGAPGILVWTRSEGGADHVFRSDLVAGEPQAAARVDAAMPAVNTPPAAAVADDGRAVVFYTNAEGAWATVRPAAGQAFGAPQKLGGPGSAWPSVDMTSGTGVAYAAWGENGNVKAAWLARGATSFSVLPGAADISESRDAGSSADTRPRVATAADGIGIVAFGETDGAVTRSGARRLVRSRLSDVVIETGVESEAGRSADRVDVAFEDDSSFGWLAFRQAYSDGSTRAVLRRIRGSRVEAPVALGDGGQVAPGAFPRVAASWREAGLAVVQAADGTVWGTIIRDDQPTTAVNLGASPGVDAVPVPAIASNEYGIAAWATPGGPGAFARNFEDDKSRSTPPPFLAGGQLSGTLGAVVTAAGMEASSNRAGDSVIAFVQESSGARSIAVASYDLAPTPVDLDTSSRWQGPRPKLTWDPGAEVWPGRSYKVYVDNVEIGTTTKPTFTPPRALAAGQRRWKVEVVDRRGQSAMSAAEPLRIDAAAPKLVVKVSGNGRLAVKAQATEPSPPKASGLAALRIDFGDGTRPVATSLARLKASHRFPSRTVTMKVTATDRAGNVSMATYRVRAGRARLVSRRAPGGLPAQ